MASRNDFKNIAKERNLKNYQHLSKEDLSRMLKIPIFLTDIIKILQKIEISKITKT